MTDIGADGIDWSRSTTTRESAGAGGAYPPTEGMLREPVDPDFQKASADRLRKAWKTPEGFRYWTAVNNSEVGLWYTLTAFFFMLCAGVLALLIRIQLVVPDNDFLSADRFNQFFTMHGSAMMFLFAVPMFEAVAILILPAFLGARDMPFPRLSAYGFWCFLIGGIFVMSSVLFGVAPDAGWFMYPPLATKQGGIGADIWLLGLSFIEVASIAAAVELIVGVLKCRPPGMRVNLMPLYAWYVLVVGGMILFAFPPLIAGDFLFELERSFDWPFFDPERGGDPLLWQHLFWIFGHPEVYIVFPALDRDRRHDHPDRGAAPDRRLFLDRSVRGRHRFPVVWPLGASHVHHGPPLALARLLLRRVRSRGDPDRRAALRLRRHADGRPGDAVRADALHRRRARNLHRGRAHRRHGRARARSTGRPTTAISSSPICTTPCSAAWSSR